MIRLNGPICNGFEKVGKMENKGCRKRSERLVTGYQLTIID